MAIATEFVDIEEAQNQAAELIKESEYRASRIESIRENNKKNE